MICDLKKTARGFRGTWMKEYLGEGGVGVGWRLQSGPVTHGAGQAARAPLRPGSPAGILVTGTTRPVRLFVEQNTSVPKEGRVESSLRVAP